MSEPTTGMAEPVATATLFEEPDAAALGGPWQLAISVTGEGFQARGLALQASVGSVMVQAIFLFPDESGFNGYLAAMPDDGDTLSIGFAVLTDTGLAYHSGDVVA